VKITKRQLRRLINEETSRVLSEQDTRDPSNYVDGNILQDIKDVHACMDKIFTKANGWEYVDGQGGPSYTTVISEGELTISLSSSLKKVRLGEPILIPPPK